MKMYLNTMGLGVVLAAIVVWAGLGATAPAASIYWNNFTAGDKDFNTAGNWSPATVPGAADTAVFTNFPST